MPALRIDDGYTLDFATEPDVKDAAGYELYIGLPVITGTYRPPSFKRLTKFRFDHGRANTGDEQARLTCDFIAERLASWDVTYGDKPAPLDKTLAEFLADKVGEPFISQLLAITARWGPKGGFPKPDAERTQEGDAGN